ncbi:MAG: ABC transporter permease [Anaeromyxobacter sp.]
MIWLNTNQYATGLAVTLFGSGLSALMGAPYVGKPLGNVPAAFVPVLGDLPFIGPALFREHLQAYLAVAITAGLAWFMYRTRSGLVLRAVGEAPQPAHALGYPVRSIRLAAVTGGGALCGLAGAHLSVFYSNLWAEGMTGGRGWFALALTVFATWRPWRLLLGAYLFGGTTILQYYLQNAGVHVNPQLLGMLPYGTPIVVLVLISRNPLWIRLNMPTSLGKPFFPGG